MKPLLADYNPISDDDLPEVKRQYAHALVKLPNDPYKAALSVNPDLGVAGWIRANLQFNQDVLDMRAEIEAKLPPKSPLPTKEEFALELLEEARKYKVMRGTGDTQLKYYDLAAKVMGYIDKPAQTNINTGTINNSKVFVVPPRVATTDKSNEQKTIDHQQRLVNQVDVVTNVG